MPKLVPKPGLRIRDLIASRVGSKDLWQGVAHVFVKAAQRPDHDLVLHEFLAARLANSLGIPVPFGEIADLGDGREAWTTAVAGRTGKFYAPPNLTEVYAREPHVFSGIATFDVWIFNPDRHAENVVWHPNIGLWAIDHEEAFVGSEGSRTLEQLADRAFLYPGRSQIGLKPETFGPWTSIIRSQGAAMASHALDVCRSRKIISAADALRYEQFLHHRARRIADLVQQSFEFEVHPESLPHGPGYTEPIV